MTMQLELDNPTFAKAFQFVMKWEGGSTITKDPDDPGGTTKYGISKRAHPSLNIELLTEEDAKTIYFYDYWKLSGANLQRPDIATVIFDTAVNMGNSRARKMATDANFDVPTMIRLRKEYYEDLAERIPSMQKYLKGWLNRTDALAAFATSLVPQTQTFQLTSLDTWPTTYS